LLQTSDFYVRRTLYFAVKPITFRWFTRRWRSRINMIYSLRIITLTKVFVEFFLYTAEWQWCWSTSFSVLWCNWQWCWSYVGYKRNLRCGGVVA